MENLRCVVERITYSNAENGYTVLKVKSKGYSELIAAVGNVSGVNVGSVLTLKVFWKFDSKHGKQFNVRNWEETLPSDIFEIVNKG